MDGMTTKILAAIVFTFIFGATLLIIAILFIIRIVVLGVLIVFSPIGFVGSILPGMKKFADDWWDALFKQSFFAPIMVFMLFLAVQMMRASNNNITKSIGSAVQSNTALGADSKSIIATGTSMAMPIVLLWLGILVSKNFGAYGAATAKKLGMGAMSKFSGLNAVKKRYAAFQTERKKRADEKFKGNLGAKLGTLANRGQDWAHGVVAKKGDEIKDSAGNVIGRAKSKSGRFVSGAKNATNRHRQMLIDKNKEDIKKQHEDLEGASTGEMHAKVDTFDVNTATHDQKIEAAAHARQAISRGREYEDQLRRMLGLTPTQIAAHRQKMRDAIKAAELSKTH